VAVQLASIIGFFSSHEVETWTLPDWVTLVGLPATVLALFLAWRHVSEIRRTSVLSQEASETAKEAAEAAKDGSEASRGAADAARGGADAARHAAEEARDAATAARGAIGRTEQKLADQNVLMLIGQVQTVIDELDRAETDKEMIRIAGVWVETASQLDGLLKAGTVHKELVPLLAPSVATAGAMKNAIILERKDLQMAATPMREELTAIKAASSRIMGHMRAHIIGEQTNA
jgi:hypothetical protein